jgi:hypothetical protein
MKRRSFAIFVSETASVFSAPVDRQSRLVDQTRAHALGELRMRVEARADGRAPQRDLPEARHRVAHAVAALPYLRRVAGELLAERDGNRVHPVRAPGLDDVVELHSLALEGLRKRVECGDEVVDDLAERGEMHGRREDVVRGLPHVHVVVRVHVLARERRDHLVRVHVRRRSGARLEDVDGELVVELAVRDARARVGDALRLVVVEQA